MIDPLAFSLSDGNITLNQTNSSVFNTLDFNVWTNSSGNLTGWFLNVLANSGISQLNTTYQTEVPFILNLDETETYTCATTCTPIAFAENLSDPGTWTVSTMAAPEPSNMFLAIVGLSVLVFGRRASACARP